MAMTKERLEEIKRRFDDCATCSELAGEDFAELIAEVERLQPIENNGECDKGKVQGIGISRPRQKPEEFMTPSQEYERLLRALVACPDRDSPEAEAICDESDKWWNKLTDAEKVEMRVLAASLQRSS